MIVLFLIFNSNTANGIIKRVIKTIDNKEVDRIQMFQMNVNKRYTKSEINVLEFVNEKNTKVLKVSVDDFMYSQCRVKSNVLLITLDNKVLFYCPTKVLNGMFCEYSTCAKKIRMTDIIEYYRIICYDIYTQLRCILDNEKEHYKTFRRDYKNRKH
jgi:hypothetical protein